MKKNIKILAITAAILAVSGTFAYASTTGMPWDSIGDKIINGLSSKFTAAIAAVAIFGAGLTLMFGEGGGFSQKALKIAFGIGIILAAANVASSWFGASGCLF